MYLIAKEAEKILVYCYKNMDNGFHINIKFDNFKNENNFQYSLEDFRKSLIYLCQPNLLKKDIGNWENNQTEFGFTVPCNLFPYIENLILQEHSSKKTD